MKKINYDKGPKKEVLNTGLPDSEVPNYFLAKDANQIATEYNNLLNELVANNYATQDASGEITIKAPLDLEETDLVLPEQKLYEEDSILFISPGEGDVVSRFPGYKPKRIISVSMAINSLLTSVPNWWWGMQDVGSYVEIKNFDSSAEIKVELNTTTSKINITNVKGDHAKQYQFNVVVEFEKIIPSKTIKIITKK